MVAPQHFCGQRVEPSGKKWGGLPEDAATTAKILRSKHTFRFDKVGVI